MKERETDGVVACCSCAINEMMWLLVEKKKSVLLITSCREVLDVSGKASFEATTCVLKILIKVVANEVSTMESEYLAASYELSPELRKQQASVKIV